MAKETLEEKLERIERDWNEKVKKDRETLEREKMLIRHAKREGWLWGALTATFFFGIMVAYSPLLNR
jgi:hypothetical protein